MRANAPREASSVTHSRGDHEMTKSDPNRHRTPLGERIRYFILVMVLFPIPVATLVGLVVLLTDPTADQFEDIDVWCEQYHPDLTHSECLDEAGL